MFCTWIRFPTARIVLLVPLRRDVHDVPLHGLVVLLQVHAHVDDVGARRHVRVLDTQVYLQVLAIKYRIRIRLNG